MPDDYDDVIARRRSERESAAQEEVAVTRDSELIRRVSFHRRNSLFEAIRRRAAELETAYPDLGQLFVDTSLGDILRLNKSKYPTGRYAIGFDSERQSVVFESTYQQSGGRSWWLQMRPAPTGQDTVELWTETRALTDDEIVKMIFDEFIPGVA